MNATNRILLQLAGAICLSHGVASNAWAEVSVSLTAPANGSVLNPPANINVSATASAGGGGYTLSKVEFFHGTTLIGSDRSAPYSVVWSNAPQGNYTLTAKATAVKKNSPDQVATSSPHNIIVTILPVVTVTSPADGVYVGAPGNFSVTASASDVDSGIASIEFVAAADLAGIPFEQRVTVTQPPYSAEFDSFGPGIAWYLSAFATDNQGAIASSNTVSVFSTSRPNVSFDSPSTGTGFTAPASVALGASASDSDGTISAVEFYNGTVIIATLTSAPYSFTWSGVPPGAYSLTARATDNHNVTTTSSPVNIIVGSAVSQIYFIHADHINTPRLVADAAGTTVWRWNQQEPFGNNVPDENPSGLGIFDLPLRFPGQTYDVETGLHYNYYRDFDPSLGIYKQSDLIGLRGGLNTYAYGSSNPLRLFDPSGLACTAMGGTVTCTPPGGPTVSFPQPAGWPAVLNPNTPNYHNYNISVQMGCANPTSVMQGIANLPTPGSPQPATPQGTLNNATPNTIQSMANFIDQLSSFGNDPGNYNNSPVISYLLPTPNGGSVVVNVTQPGHPLWPGYVARTINGGSVNNFGEGAAWLQGPNSPFASQINNVWQAQTRGVINNSAQRCGCQP